jgi:uncharacterized protein YjbJ (UPF0337 family)
MATIRHKLSARPSSGTPSTRDGVVLLKTFARIRPSPSRERIQAKKLANKFPALLSDAPRPLYEPWHRERSIALEPFTKCAVSEKKNGGVMDWNRIEGNWKQFKGRAKEKWGRLTDDDLDVVNGRQEQLEGKIQERYGLAKDEAKKDVEAWFKSLP